MKVVFIVIAAVLVVVALLIPIYLYIFQPDQLPAARDAAVIYTSLFMCVGAILFIIMTALLVYIAFILRDHLVPTLDKVDDTVKTVKGTTTFISESVVSPIVKIAGAAAGVRAMVQTLMRRKPPQLEEAKKEEDKSK